MNLEQVAVNSVSTRTTRLGDAIEAYAAAGFRRVEFALSQVKQWFETGQAVDDLAALLIAMHRRLRDGGLCLRRHCRLPRQLADAQGDAKPIAQFGGQTLVVGTDGPCEDFAPGGALAQIGWSCAELADQIDPTVSLAIEFNWSPVVRSVRSVKRLEDAARHRHVGILFDPAHFHGTTSKLEDLADKVVAKIVHVHMDDMADVSGEHANCDADRVLPGDEILDLQEIVDRLEHHNYRGFFSIDLFNEQLWQTPGAEAVRRMYGEADLTGSFDDLLLPCSTGLKHFDCFCSSITFFDDRLSGGVSHS